MLLRFSSEDSTLPYDGNNKELCNESKNCQVDRKEKPKLVQLVSPKRIFDFRKVPFCFYPKSSLYPNGFCYPTCSHLDDRKHHILRLPYGMIFGA